MLFGWKKDPMDVVEGVMKARAWQYGRQQDIILSFFGRPEAACFLSVHREADKKVLMFLANPAVGMVHMAEALASGRLPFLRAHAAAGHTADQVAKVCEHLLHRNYEMVLGAFERDQSDGEIRCRVALPYRDTTVTPEQVGVCLERLISTTLVMIPNITAILGGKQPSSGRAPVAV